MSAFVFSGGHFWPPCVGGFFFPVPDPLGMRQPRVHYYDPVAPMPDRQPWSCKYELVDAIRVCSG